MFQREIQEAHLLGVKLQFQVEFQVESGFDASTSELDAGTSGFDAGTSGLIRALCLRRADSKSI